MLTEEIETNEITEDLFLKYRVENFTKRINVKIKGKSPYLFCSPEYLKEQDETKTSKLSSVKLTRIEEAKQSLYWNKDKTSLMTPATCVKRCLSDAANPYKIGKASVGVTFSKISEITPAELLFNTTKYEIDSRRACPPGASRSGSKPSIIRSRACIFPWELSFTINYDSRYLMPKFMEGQFIQLVVDAGNLQGLGAFAPRHRGGPFGKFDLIEYIINK